MNYIGSGFLSKICNIDKSNDADVIIWGRRALNSRLTDYKQVYKKNCIFLDTIYLNNASLKNIKFFIYNYFHPYRIEKRILYFFLKIISSKIIRVQVPLITDSPTWIKEIEKKSESTIEITGFTYSQLYIVLKNVIFDKSYILSAHELIEYGKKFNLLTKITVSKNKNSIKFLLACLNNR